jgi:glucose-1-phosphate thymidylyltransferase
MIEENPFSQITGVILAAGKGNRALPLTNHYLKTLLPICNRPIIDYHLQELSRLGIRRVIILLGHLKEQFYQYLEHHPRYDLEIQCREQKEQAGIAHALLELESFLDKPFLLVLGDIFFIPRDLPSIAGFFSDPNFGAGLAARWEDNPEYLKRNFLIETDRNNRVWRVTEKPDSETGGLKGCGVYFFKASIFEAIRRTPRSSLRNEYELTDAIQTLINQGFWVTSHNVVDWDMNITLARDILTCNQYCLSRRGLNRIVAPGVRIPEDARIDRSVIGEGAVVGQGAVIEQSVIFPGAVIPPGAHFQQTILTPYGLLQFDES